MEKNSYFHIWENFDFFLHIEKKGSINDIIHKLKNDGFIK